MDNEKIDVEKTLSSNDGKSVSLPGKYHLSAGFLKLAAPIYIFSLLAFFYGQDWFGAEYTETMRGFTFGILMFFVGILASANMSIWVPNKSKSEH